MSDDDLLNVILLSLMEDSDDISDDSTPLLRDSAASNPQRHDSSSDSDDPTNNIHWLGVPLDFSSARDIDRVGSVENIVNYRDGYNEYLIGRQILRFPATSVGYRIPAANRVLDSVADNNQVQNEANSRASDENEDFDEDITAEHRYLGDNFESVNGRTIYAEGSRVTIPLIIRPNGTLVPGQTFPMRVSDRIGVCLLRKCIRNDKTFGCLGTTINLCDDYLAPVYGTTAEIYEYADELLTVSIKARARQRFKTTHIYMTPEGQLMGDVVILPEIELPSPLKNFMSKGQGVSTTSLIKKRQRQMGAAVSRWPLWVFDQYDINKLTERVDKELGFLQEGLRKERGKAVRPQGASDLSYWIGSYLDAENRLFLIKLDSSVQRIRWELSVIKTSHIYGCNKCHNPICNAEDIFSMSTDGPQNTYVNLAGIIHDIVTFKKANNLILTSQPSPLFSWFPGYSWSIADCNNCLSHVGWAFLADNPRYRPNSFWGFSRNNLFLCPAGETLTD